jgi:hypothetical protein
MALFIFQSKQLKKLLQENNKTNMFSDFLTQKKKSDMLHH